MRGNVKARSVIVAAIAAFGVSGAYAGQNGAAAPSDRQRLIGAGHVPPIGGTVPGNAGRGWLGVGAPKTFAQYQDVVELLQHSLNGYAYLTLSALDAQRSGFLS